MRQRAVPRHGQGEETEMTSATSPAPAQASTEPQVADVFVVFGITGDLAKVMTFRNLMDRSWIRPLFQAFHGGPGGFARVGGSVAISEVQDAGPSCDRLARQVGIALDMALDLREQSID